MYCPSEDDMTTFQFIITALTIFALVIIAVLCLCALAMEPAELDDDAPPPAKRDLVDLDTEFL
jgi:hypothetical protein